MHERLQKILSRAGFASRRGAERVMAEGRLTVNGQVVTELGTKADLATDDVRVDGVRVPAPAAPVYLLLYKPKGVVTTRHDPEGRPTVMDLVPRVAGLFPVGRLDVTTEGLILLTNDGAFAERVSHPRFEVPRVYHAKVHRVPDAATLARLREGVRVEGQRMAVDAARVIEQDKNSWVEVTLHEGKHHEVKRLLEAVGHPVSKLRRVAVGPLTLRGLKPGEFRALLPQEVKGLLAGGRARAVSSPRPFSRTARSGARPPRTFRSDRAVGSDVSARGSRTSRADRGFPPERTLARDRPAGERAARTRRPDRPRDTRAAAPRRGPRR
jgi:23S rRNA pseudouridine2605 synthase